MIKSEHFENESVSKGNSEDSLLPIYILQVLKKYSSPKNPLSSQDVMDHLRDDYSIGSFDKSDAQRKKVRRHLDTLHESFWNGCIKKEEGKTRNGHKWYYDASKDNDLTAKATVEETLSNEEIDFLVDIITSSKIINTKSTSYIIKNLLKKSNLSKDEINARLRKIENEKWQKSINDDLGLLKQDIQSCIEDGYKIRFDYEDKKSILVSPHGWGSDENGKYALIAKTEDNDEGEFSYFVLNKIENLEKTDSKYYYDDAYYDSYFGKADELSIESLFSNIKIINDAIESKKGIEFEYLYYAIIDERVDVTRKDKRVLPNRLVFNDGKYYLIGYNEEDAKINYYRVDLISKLSCSNVKINISYYNKQMMDGIEIAREIEKHPLMLAERDVPIAFNVVESALNRVIDAFGKNATKFEVTNETRVVGNSAERLVKFEVRTTKDEAFRWAMANADVVELVSPQDVRDRIGRIASSSIDELYSYTLLDKLRKNVDSVLNEGVFQISHNVDKDTAYATYKELARMKKLDVVKKLFIDGDDELGDLDYFGDFVNATHLAVHASQLNDIPWASRLVNVTTLDLTASQIVDVSWMKAMKRLIRVLLSNSSVTDLSVLSEHTNIDWISISGTNVSDISFIEKYKKLTQLDIAVCPIEDYSPLFTMKSHLKILEINKSALEKIGEKNIKNCHFGISIQVTNDSSFWHLSY